MQKAKIKLTLNIVCVILLMVAFTIAHNTEAGSSPLADDDTIGWSASQERPITFGEFYDFQEANNPNLLEYCEAKAYTAMGMFNERETLSFDEMLDEVSIIKNKGIEVHLEFVRMARDITRKDNQGRWLIEYTPEKVAEYANGELHQCVLQEF